MGLLSPVWYNPRHTPHRYWMYVSLIVFGTILIRLALALTHDSYLGIDGGAYLLHAKRLMGFLAPNIDFQRAPLGPGYLLVPFLHLWGDDVGYKVWATIFSTVPLIPCAALLAYRILPYRRALIATGLLAINPWNWEQLVTGALPAIGIGLIFLCLWGLIPMFQREDTWKDRLAVVGAIALIPYINHTSTGLAAVAIPAFIGSSFWILGTLRPMTRVLPWLALGATLALPAIVLFYGDVLFGGPRMTFPGPKIFIPQGYTPATLLALYSIPVAWHAKTHGTLAHKALAAVLVVHAIAGLFSSYDEAIINIMYRSQYIGSALMIMLGVSYVADTIAGRRIAQRVVTSAVAAFLTISSIFIWMEQTYYSDIYTRQFEHVVTQIPDEYEGPVLVNTFPMAMWVAAIDARPAVWLFQASPPRMYVDQYQLSRCVLGWRDNCDPRESAAALGVRYVVINTQFPFPREPNYWGAPPRDRLWEPLAAAPWLTLKESTGTIQLWEIV